jgi:hypothetical protein
LDSKGEKGKYKIQNAMHRIFCRDDQYCEEYGQKRDEVKYIHVSITKYLCTTFKKEMGKGIKLLY